MNESYKIVFFDGVCNLCNRFVDFLLRRNSRKLKFASLQGATAQEYLPKEWTESLPSLVFWDHGRVYTESSAVVHILMKLGGLYALAAFLLLIPAQIRNRVYRWVARNRYRWFGKRELCRLPTQEERSRFLA